MEASHERPSCPGVLGPETKAKGHCHLLHQNASKTKGCWGKGAFEAALNAFSWVEMSQEVMSANPLIKARLEANGSEKVFGIEANKPHPPPSSLLLLEIRAG